MFHILTHYSKKVFLQYFLSQKIFCINYDFKLLIKVGPKKSPQDYLLIACFLTPHYKVAFLSLLNYTYNIAVLVFFFFLNNDMVTLILLLTIYVIMSFDLLTDSSDILF